MAALRGRVIIVTGAGRGLGREYARLIAAEGGHVVADDIGCRADGSGSDPGVVDHVVHEIREGGGTALARSDDVRTMVGATNLLQAALDEFGVVHGLVNNAGILRDRMFVNMSEEEWDEVITGQLKSTFSATRVLAGYWRDRAKADDPLQASVVNVSSTSGLLGQPGQSNYGAAKAGIASLSIILAQELARYGVRVNAITPVARTRMTEDVPGIKEIVAAPEAPEAFDVYHPGNVAPLVAWLMSEGCPVTGHNFYVKGGEVRQFCGWHYGETVEIDDRWTVTQLDEAMPTLL